ncbi:MAG: hypothetical protein TREMPRED_003184 [Tremellales sp. Tagirdzhanova-0007]|nr:MAG: hypothetical protein TREMPRED_003184 [Tremellales sp. Tagirdzhanova-0007]
MRSSAKDQLDVLKLREWSQQWILTTSRATQICDQGQKVKDSISKIQDNSVAQFESWLGTNQQSIFTHVAKAMNKCAKQTNESYKSHAIGYNTQAPQDSSINKEFESTLQMWT